MKLNKIELKKIVLEALQQQNMSNNTSQVTDKEVFKQNTIKHIRMLKLLKSTVKQVGTSPQLKTMIDQFQKSHTSEFLQQVLHIKDSISVRVAAVFENPMELMNDVIDEVIREATKNAQQKLHEQKEFSNENEMKTNDTTFKSLIDFINKQIDYTSKLPELPNDENKFGRDFVQAKIGTLTDILDEVEAAVPLNKLANLLIKKIKFGHKNSSNFMETEGKISACRDVLMKINNINDGEDFLQEKKDGELPFLTRDEARLEKHKEHERKKKGPPPPVGIKTVDISNKVNK